jgi:hypothetical protein
MAYSYDRTKTAAVDKVPVFNKFEVRIGAEQLEKIVSKSYKVVPGSLKIRPGVERDRNGAYINFKFEFSPTTREQLVERINGAQGKIGTGSVVMFMDNDGNSIRCVAWVNVDG